MSHHFDSPTAIEDGRLNLCDLYVFPETPDTSTLVLTVNPDSGRSNPTTFRPDALYEFVIASDGSTREDRAWQMSSASRTPTETRKCRSATLSGRAGQALKAADSAPAIPGEPSR
jgi:hypothetical protein